MGAIFALSFYLVSSSRHTLPPYSPAALLKPGGMPSPHTLLQPRQNQQAGSTSTFSCGTAKAGRDTVSTQGMSLEHLALVASRVSVSEPYRTETIGERALGRLLPPRAHHRKQTETQSQSSYEKGIYLLVLELQPEGQASGLPHT